MRELKISLPWPRSELNGHNTGHWKKKAGIVAAARNTARLLALSQNNHRPCLSSIRLALELWLPDEKGYDPLNVVNALKPSIDGLTDAGWILDDNWRVVCGVDSLEILGIDRTNPRVEMTIREIDRPDWHNKCKSVKKMLDQKGILSFGSSDGESS